MSQRLTVVFDLGGVLIDWNPRYLYRKLFPGDEAGEAAMEHFLANVCSNGWNVQQDAGRSLAEAYAVLAAEHPDKRELIEAWGPRFDEMMAGAIEGTVAVLSELRARGTPLYALSNWSDETFHYALRRFEFLGWFKDIVVSGRLKLIKPDPRIYQHLFAKHGLRAQDTVFIDDSAKNITTAAELGMEAILFTDPAALRTRLQTLQLLP